MNEIYVLPKWNYTKKAHELACAKKLVKVIDTTSGSGDFRGLSPFVLGPCPTYLPGYYAQNFENLWQYSKVYPQHVIDDTKCETGFSTPISLLHPSNGWYQWRMDGWANPKAVRYPMGKGVKPLFSHWESQNLTYVQARKWIYALNYFANVVKTESFKRLKELYQTNNLILLDYDAYDHQAMGRTLKDVINDPDRKCGHAFILAMTLTGVLPDCVEF